jgi:hypothetical protein
LVLALDELKRSRFFGPLIGKIPRGAKVPIAKMLKWHRAPSPAQQIVAQQWQIVDLMALRMYEEAFSSPRFREPKRLLASGFKVYSQHDEDGILEEIFRRVGVTNRFFVEFGVGDGMENCTLYRLLQGWNGAWIECSPLCFEAIQHRMGFLINSGQLRAKYSFITAENIEHLFAELNVPAEFDLLSIDIDGNDYWVWNAIGQYRPRVVVIEYNASFQRTVACTVPYAPTAIWDRSNYYGASLKALELLGAQKAYRLVGCNYTGVSAFFVREDCAGDHFASPFTAENHYEPPRYFVRMSNGHPPGFGPVVRVEDLLRYPSSK